MKVRAKALGYYGDKRRKEGEEFELIERTVGDKEKRRKLSVDQQFSDIWMEKVGQPANGEPESAPSKKPGRPPSARKSNVI